MCHKEDVFIIDVSGFLFRAYFAVPAMFNSKNESVHAVYGFIRSLLKLFKTIGVKKAIAVFDGENNKQSRKEIYADYKSNRTKVYDDLPGQIEKAKLFCSLMGLPVFSIPGVEADDVIGSISKIANNLNKKAVICSGDKDFLQLVSDKTIILNPWKDNKIITEEDVPAVIGVKSSQVVDYLAMVGDVSDNVPGIAGIGPKTACELLKEFETLENILLNINSVKGARKQTLLRTQSEKAIFSKRLVIIDQNIPIENELLFNDFVPDQVALDDYYLEMGFFSFISKKDFVKAETKDTIRINCNSLGDLNAFIQKSKIEAKVAVNIMVSIDGTIDIVELTCNEVEVFCLNSSILNDEEISQALKLFFCDQDIVWVIYDAKTSWKLFKDYEARLFCNVFDVLLAAYLLNMDEKKWSLESVFEKHLDNCGDDYKSRESVVNLLLLENILKTKLEEKKLDKVFFDIEVVVAKMLLSMEHKGMYVDIESLSEFALVLEKESKDLAERMFEITGERFNINSPKQLSGILFDKLGIKKEGKEKKGKVSTNALVLEELIDCHPVIGMVLDYRSIEKIKTSYANGLKKFVSQIDNRIHPTFNQTGTITGRLSCKDPNLQNIPIKSDYGKQIRQRFTVDKPEWSYVSADYSQIELRLLAHFSQDPTLTEAFNNGEDVHSYTASVVFDVEQSKVTPDLRRKAKAVNFGILYGLSGYGLSKQLAISVGEANKIIEAYFSRFSFVDKFIKKCIDEARENGFIKTLLGRERAVPELRYNNAIARKLGERLSINAMLQGSAADLIKIAMVEVKKKIAMYDSFLLLQVHDELIFEVKNEDVNIFCSDIKQVMEGVYSLNIPLLVDVSVGKNWAEC